MNKRWLIGTSLLVAISLLLVGCQGGPTAEEIVAKMKEVEASTEDAHAILEVSIQGQGTDEELVIEVWEKKPDKFRAEVLKANDPELVGSISVADGHQVWMYQPSQNEVVVGEVGPEEPSSPRQLIQFMDEAIQRVLDTSDVELVGEEDVAGYASYQLAITPRDEEDAVLPMGGKATLWVDQERWIVLQAHVSGEMLGEGWVRVRSFEFNTGIADDRFRFEIPEGAQVTDMEDKRPTPITLDEARAQADFPLLVPGYLPEGTALVDVLAVDEAFIFRYNHSTISSFTIVQGSISGRQSLPPSSQKTEVSVRGQTATLISDDGPGNLLTWTENGVVVTIAGHISQDEILKVAESLE